MLSHHSYAGDLKRPLKALTLILIFSHWAVPRKASYPEAEFLETLEDLRKMQTQVPRLEIEARASASLETAFCTAWPSTEPRSSTSSGERYRSKFQFPHTSAGTASKEA
jgi:hypothetical protein